MIERTKAGESAQRAAAASLRPPRQLTVSAWADRERYLSPESSAEPGRWRTSRVPYLKEIMDAVTDPAIRKIDEQNRYAACVRFNAKNPNGAYAGVRDQMAIFLAGKLDQMGVTRDLCKDAVYEPFPELERLTR